MILFTYPSLSVGYIWQFTDQPYIANEACAKYKLPITNMNYLSLTVVIDQAYIYLISIMSTTSIVNIHIVTCPPSNVRISQYLKHQIIHKSNFIKFTCVIMEL